MISSAGILGVRVQKFRICRTTLPAGCRLVIFSDGLSNPTSISELSTPILEVWEGVLCMPVVGIMDSTGIDVMDTRAVDHFVRMAKAVRLLGSECVLTGMNPHIAQTVVHMELDLSNIRAGRVGVRGGAR